MKIMIRLLLSITAVVTVAVLLFTVSQIRHEERTMLSVLNQRAGVLSVSMEEAVDALPGRNIEPQLRRLIERSGRRDGFVGVALFRDDFSPLAMSARLNPWMSTTPAELSAMSRDALPRSRIIEGTNGVTLHTHLSPLHTTEDQTYILGVFQSIDHMRDRTQEIWRQGFFRLLIQALLIAFITVVTVRWTLLAPLSSTVDWIKKLRAGQAPHLNPPLPKDIFGPLAKEVTHIATSLATARAAAEEEAKLRQTAESIWTAERLKEHIRTTLDGKMIMVISNREPYIHSRKGNAVEWVVPASGLVTALEPILQASNGLWIAHGAGDADRATVDSQDHVSVPPDDPQYTLRRVWLSKEEEDGYYYGFSNEGIWPLCHIAHTRPLFLPEDWAQYQAVNEKFAAAALEEIKDKEEPIILIQDYHLALLPRLIKTARPDARVGVFWHIPWPNPESFGICPWGRELLHGMLGADLLGFHIQYHCNNFLDTVDRVLESRIDWERFAVNRQGHTTWVKPFPISVDLSNHTSQLDASKQTAPSKESIFKDLNLKAEFLGVGVDRIDYTKGIIERFRGIERFLDKYKQYQGRFTFVELGAPSRTLIKRYHDLIAEVEEESERINWKFKTKDWKPIVFLKKHHSHKDIQPYYKAADVCLVTSLHDGMNLVAKEYVAAKETDDGALILSRFTGASREFRDALIVNPYDIDQLAESIRFALEMDPDEKAIRMRRMKTVLRENNIHKWGANLITELSQIRLVQNTVTADK